MFLLTVLAVVQATLGDNLTTLLVALFGGAIASAIAALFARPKTKAEADQANANATVSLSAEARTWAELWMTKAEKADERAKRAEERAEGAEERAESAERRVGVTETRLGDLESALAACFVHIEVQQGEINRLGGHVPDLPPALHEWESLLRARDDA